MFPGYAYIGEGGRVQYFPCSPVCRGAGGGCAGRLRRNKGRKGDLV